MSEDHRDNLRVGPPMPERLPNECIHFGGPYSWKPMIQNTYIGYQSGYANTTGSGTVIREPCRRPIATE